MSDVPTQYFVQAFVRFLNQQISAGGYPADTSESLEVAVQCLETAYNLPVEVPTDAASTAATIVDPMTHVDLLQLFLDSCAGHPERKREAEQVKNEGNTLMREEKYEEALMCYNRYGIQRRFNWIYNNPRNVIVFRAISLDATNPVFYCNRAATLSRLGDFQRAADDCKLSLRYDPKYSKAFGRLGIAYSKLNKLDLAVDAYQKALELEPNNQDYLNNLNVAKQHLEEAMRSQSSTTNSPDTSSSSGGQHRGVPPVVLPTNIQLPQSMSGFQDIVQQVVNDPSQLNSLLSTFQRVAGGQSPDGNDPMAGLAGLLGGSGGINFQALINQIGGVMEPPGGGAPNGSSSSQPWTRGAHR